MTLDRRSLTLAGIAALLPVGARAAAAAPAFSVKDADGKTRTLSEFAGKTVVLEWINEGCPYVKKHYAGNMQALQKAARAEGVVWLTVCSSAPGKQGHWDGKAAKAWMAEKGGAPSAILLDPAGTMGKAYGAKTTPHMYVIKAGQIVYQGGIDDKPTANAADIPGAANYVTAALADVKAGRAVRTAFAKPYGGSVKYPEA